MTNEQQFKKAIQSVNSGRYSYKDEYWRGAVSHLGFELKYSLDKEKQSVFTQKAIQILNDELKEICNNHDIPTTAKEKELSELYAIIGQANPEYSEDFIKRATELRRVLICIEYIKQNNCI